ncbi:MAG: M12 family metallopeptidase [Asticcacaulis sp.]
MRGMIFALMVMLGVPGMAQAASVMTGVQPWRNGVVPYRIEADLLKQAGAAGEDCSGWKTWRNGPARHACRAMDDWTQHSGMRFVAGGSRVDAVAIRTGAATTGTLGRLPMGNRVTIEPGVPYGSVLHEFGHVLGLMHEHQRPDRDVYLRIEPFLADLLKRCTVISEVCRDVRLSFPTVSVKASTAYDPCSLMHYLANQGPRHREDKRWSRIFTLTDKGKAALDTCVGQFARLPERCRKVGQKCAISRLDAELVARFNSAFRKV